MYSIEQKLSNKHSAIVTYEHWKLIAHTFDNIVLRVNPSLTSCEDLAIALVCVWVPKAISNKWHDVA